MSMSWVNFIGTGISNAACPNVNTRNSLFKSNGTIQADTSSLTHTRILILIAFVNFPRKLFNVYFFSVWLRHRSQNSPHRIPTKLSRVNDIFSPLVWNRTVFSFGTQPMASSFIELGLHDVDVLCVCLCAILSFRQCFTVTIHNEPNYKTYTCIYFNYTLACVTINRRHTENCVIHGNDVPVRVHSRTSYPSRTGTYQYIAPLACNFIIKAICITR